MALSNLDREDLEIKLRTQYKPATPINRLELFSGRQHESRSLIAAVNQNGQHAILFGERGVGKTSLANVLFALVESPGWPKLVAHINCARNDSYSTLWQRVFVEVAEQIDKWTFEFELPKKTKKVLRLAQEQMFDNVTMDIVRNALASIGEKALTVVVIDEFDTIADPELRAAIADTIKYLSDRNTPCTVVLVGVADDVDGLIADHRSVERCLAQVRMPRMSVDEIEDINIKCLARVGMTITNRANREISRIAKGLPHYAHLLGLHSAIQAVKHGSLDVSHECIMGALKSALEVAHQSIQQAYFRATESSQRTAKYREVLLACAMAETNDLGFFSPADVRGPLSIVLKKPARIEAFSRHLHAFCDDDSGPVLKKITIRGHPQFRFANTLLQPFVVITGLADGTIMEQDLATKDKGKLF